MLKLTFSGHESFTCRQLWLKKGYDFLQQKQRFGNADAVVYLGVGKNMVNSIHYLNQQVLHGMYAMDQTVT